MKTNILFYHWVQVLFDDKKIVEQSLEEKDHPRDTLEELQFVVPKDAQVNVKEVTQISKARVDNKDNEQILSVEFAEPKEARWCNCVTWSCIF